MFDRLVDLLATDAWWEHIVYIAIFYLVAWVVHRLARFIARGVIRLSRLTPKDSRPRPERRETLRSVIASAISFIAFMVATVASLGRFVHLDTLVWLVGLFSTAFGLSARPLISDVMAGIGLIFEDTFAVGEKVEILDVEGVVEAVNLRTSWVRAPTGELYVVPNGEIRVVRNFSRGHFSTVKIVLNISSADLSDALLLLEELGKEAVILLPNLLEPWQVLSEAGVIGKQMELALFARARFGKAAEMRPRLLALVQERLAGAGITLTN
ncbi:MAG: mechanosensitive ion channel [Chloroflexota bacterium]|nr:mechanosensitive ion channel [Chloroflexota bacterium]